MSLEQFLHGVEAIQLNDGIRPIRTVRTSVIGVIGTAPNADASIFPLNTPVLVLGDRTKAAALGTIVWMGLWWITTPVHISVLKPKRMYRCQQGYIRSDKYNIIFPAGFGKLRILR